MKTFDSSSGRGSLSLVNDALPQLRGSAKKTARYILARPRESINLTITELAKEVDTSEASIVRFAQSLGFSGFQALRIALAEDLVSPLQLVHEQINADDDCEAIVQKVFTSGMRSLEDTAEVLDADLVERVVTAMSEAKQIYIFASGNSIPLAMDFRFRLTKIGLLCRFAVEPTLQEMSATLATEDDVAVGISQTGSSKDTIHCMDLARKAGAMTIALTNHSRSPLADISDICLVTAVRQGIFREEEMASSLAAMMLIEAIYVGICVHRHDASIEAARMTRRATVDRKF
jgi:RpiR family carbohydrate utilization transcriptional regulator